MHVNRTSRSPLHSKGHSRFSVKVVTGRVPAPTVWTHNSGLVCSLSLCIMYKSTQFIRTFGKATSPCVYASGQSLVSRTSKFHRSSSFDSSSNWIVAGVLLSTSYLLGQANVMKVNPTFGSEPVFKRLLNRPFFSTAIAECSPSKMGRDIEELDLGSVDEFGKGDLYEVKIHGGLFGYVIYV